MPEMLIWITAVFAYVIGRMGEYRVHRVNYEQLKEAGAEELMPRLMSRYYHLTILIIPIAVVEQFWFEEPIYWEMWAGGLGALVLAQLLRLWSIHALGTFWSMRCLTLSGAVRVTSGPYRFLRNPEYLSRILDGVGICTIFGAKLSLAFYLIVAISMTARIVSVEQRQLRELASSPF